MIDQTYPHGQLVAIHEGRIVADARTLDEVDGILDCLQIHSEEVLVVQAGFDYPEYPTILLQS